MPWLAQLCSWLSYIAEPQAPGDSLGFHRFLLPAQETTKAQRHTFTDHRWLGPCAHMCHGTKKVTAQLEPQRSQTPGRGRRGPGSYQRFSYKHLTSMPRNQHPQLSSVGFLTILKNLCVHPSLDKDMSSCFRDFHKHTHTPQEIIRHKDYHIETDAGPGSPKGYFASGIKMQVDGQGWNMRHMRARTHTFRGQAPPRTQISQDVCQSFIMFLHITPLKIPSDHLHVTFHTLKPVLLSFPVERRYI